MQQRHRSGSLSSSGSGGHGGRRPRGAATAHYHVNAGMHSLAARLAQAEAEMHREDPSGPGSWDSSASEDRDTLVQSQIVEEELEQRSNTGSSVSAHTNTTSRSGDTAHADKHHPGGRDPEAARCHAARYSLSAAPSLVTRLSEESRPAAAGSSSSGDDFSLEKRGEQPKEQKANDTDIAELRLIMDSMAKKHAMEMDFMHKELKKTMKREMHKSEEQAYMAARATASEARHENRAEELNDRVKTIEAARLKVEEEKGDLQDLIVGQEARANAKVRNLKNEFAVRLEEQDAIQECNAAAQEGKTSQLKSMNLQLEKELQSVKSVSKNVVAERDVLRHNLKNIQASHVEEVTALKEKLDIANVELQRARGEGMSLARETSTKTSNGPSEHEKVADLSAQLVQSREQHRKMTSELSELRLQMLGIKQVEEESKDSRAEAVAAASADSHAGSGHAPVEATVGDLQMLLRDANNKCPDIPFESGSPNKSLSLNLKTKARGPRFTKVKGMGGGFMKLTSIDECDLDFSMDGSAAASGNVSSDGGDCCVGDLSDFDEMDPKLGLPLPDREERPMNDLVRSMTQQKTYMQGKIDELRGRVTEDHDKVDKIKEELAEKEAIHNSKVARLMGIVESTKGANDQATRALRDLEQLSQMKDSEHRAQMDELQGQLKLSEERFHEIQSECTAMKQTDVVKPPRPSAVQQEEEQQLVESLRQQLCCALEARRMAEARLEEFKRAMEIMETQHADIVNDLKQQLAGSGTGLRGGGAAGSPTHGSPHHSPDDQLEDLRQQLRSSVEERNVLTNSLEWKEVQWKSKVENMEMNHTAEIKDLQCNHETEVKDLTSKLEGELDQARQQVAEARKEMSKTQDAPRVQAPQAPAWASLLRCPARAPAAAASSVAYTQDGCWRLLSTMQGIMALMCNVRDYKIEEATRTACMTWGSGALHGESVLTLVNKPSRAVWLRKAFQMHQSIAESKRQSEGNHSLVVRDLGCEEFTSRSGRGFDASVIAAHFPPEGSNSKEEAMLLVVIEPQKPQNPLEPPGASSSVGAPPTVGAPGNAGASRTERRERHSSGNSEVSTIHPSDSASNIQYTGLGRR